MQSTITKKLFQNAVKVSSRVVQSTVQQAAVLQACTQVNTVSSLTQSVQRSFSTDTQFEKVTSYESLISRISNATNFNDLLNVMQQNSALYKNEHIVLTLRVLARLLKSNVKMMNLEQDERYKSLIRKTEENLADFNEYEVLDFLFWFRRFKSKNVPTLVSDASLSHLFIKIKDFVKAKSFNFRNLVNLFYDLSSLNRDNDDIAIELINELRTDNKLLTPFTAVQLLQACYKRQGRNTSREIMVADYVQQSLRDMLSEFDSDQKCLVFKYLSALELQITCNSFKVPGVLYKLRGDLKQILDQLSEIAVINVISAYVDLPREFPNDLLDEIKEMVLVTIEHNSENIKSFFLVDFLEQVSLLPRNRRLSPEKINLVLDEIAKRLPEGDFIARLKTVDRLVSAYIKLKIPPHEEFLNQIYNKIAGLETPYFSGGVLQMLSENGKDITPILDKYIEGEHFNQAEFWSKAQLFMIISTIKSDKYTDLVSTLKEQVLTKPEDTYKIIKLIPNFNYNNVALEELSGAAIESLKKQWGTMKNNNFYRLMFQSIHSRKSREYWNSWVDTVLPTLDAKDTNKFIETFFSTEKRNINSLVVFIRAFTYIPNDKIDIRRLLAKVKTDKSFASEIAREERLLHKFLQKIVRVMEQQSETISQRLDLLLSFIMRLDAANVQNDALSTIARRGYLISKNAEHKTNLQTEVLYSIYLADKGFLKPDEAKDLYERTKERTSRFAQDQNLRLLGYSMRGNNSTNLSEEQTNDINKRLETLQKDLVETSAKTVLQALRHIYSLPSAFLEPNKNLYLKALKSHLGLGNVTQYLDILFALQKSHVKMNFPFYFPILKELLTNYTNISMRMTPHQITRVLEKFTELNTKSPTIYNNILADIGNHFNVFKAEDISAIVLAFSNAKIKQSDLFDKIVLKFGGRPHDFRSSVFDLVFGLYKVGFTSQQAKVVIPETMDKIRINNTNENIAYALYLSILNLDDEVAQLEKLIPKLQGKISRRIPKNNIYNLYQYMRLVHNDKPEWAETVQKIIPDFENYSQVLKNSDKNHNTKQKALIKIQGYLEAMQVESQINYEINGYNIDLYIPQQKAIVSVLVPVDLNFDKYSLTGGSLLKKKIYNTFEGYTALTINMTEFDSILEPTNRISYLAGTGITNNNLEGKYDLSKFEEVAPRKNEVDEAQESVFNIHEEEEEVVEVKDDTIIAEEPSIIIDDKEIEIEEDKKEKTH